MKKSLKVVRMHWPMYNELYNYRTNIATGEKERVQVRCVFQ